MTARSDRTRRCAFGLPGSGTRCLHPGTPTLTHPFPDHTRSPVFFTQDEYTQEELLDRYPALHRRGVYSKAVAWNMRVDTIHRFLEGALQAGSPISPI